MKTLAIDTSSRFLSVAVAEDAKILASSHRESGMKHAAELIPVIEKMLAKLRLRLDELDGFSINVGPGSFTGLRIGVTTVKGLALALKKPVAGIVSLDVLAHSLSGINTQICPLLDAKKGNVYACLYESRASRLKRLTPYLLIEPHRLLSMIRRPTIFLGDGIPVYRELILKRKKTQAQFSEEKYWYPNARGVARMGMDKLKKKMTVKIDMLRPLYLYSKYCQIKR